jgi:hypothetical protein
MADKVSRNIIFVEDHENSNQSIISGQVPYTSLQSIQDEIYKFSIREISYSALKRGASNSHIKFEKSRFSFAKNSVEQAKNISEMPVHPFYK